jgi:predicted metal-dependent peptidase
MLMDDYKRGIDLLFYSSPVFSALVLALGKPRANEDISTARVGFDAANEQLFFEINPTFLAELDDERVAAVIAHEAYHIILRHLFEVQDRKTFPKKSILVAAQECIINDGLLPLVGVDIGEGYYSGPKLYDTDFSSLSSKSAYAIIERKLQEKDEEQEKQDADTAGASSGQSSSEDSSGVDSSEGPSQENSAPGDAIEQDGDEASSQADGADAASSEDEAEGPENEPTGCGGFEIAPEDEEAFNRAAMKAFRAMAGEVAPSEVPDTLKDAVEDFSQKTGEYFPGFASGGPALQDFIAPPPGAKLETRWRDFLARINPRVLQAGGQKKTKDSWAGPRRKMVASYPRIILPTSKPLRGTEDKGNQVPVVIFALDLSGSIPRHLVNDLIAMMESIPEDIIRAHAVTWSNTVVPFNKQERRVVAAGGTNINLLYQYTQDYAKREGVTPYVVPITDGACSFSPNLVDAKIVQEKWFWMAIQNSDVRTIKQRLGAYISAETNIYRRSDFTF